MHEALYWKKRDKEHVVCELCPRLCVLKEGQLGACGVRQVKDSKLYAMTYGKPCAMHVDPVEKKPFFHFFPGEPIFSIATIGCNLFCDFCQNWQISTARVEQLSNEQEVSPEEIIGMTKEAGCRLIAFTYTEPTIYYEYMLAIAKATKKAGMECVIVSNGYINEAPLTKLIPYISAANIDLKGTKEFYRRRCKVPDFEYIKRSIVILKKAGINVEVTNLLIPGENDTDEEIDALARWVAEELGRETPLHFSAYHPNHKMQTAATRVATLLKARDIARRHVQYVYLGNVAGVDNDTRCDCGATCIERSHYRGRSLLTNGRCPQCHTKITGRYDGSEREMALQD